MILKVGQFTNESEYNRPMAERNGRELRRKETLLKRMVSDNFKINKILQKYRQKGF